ncbi:MAG: hypothetical protein GEU26_02665 [Nitrososphaeraceae archaeon]|nr:hypothetical protein [Nitrososphaeraceae archaeon]
MKQVPKFSEKLWEWRSFNKTFHKYLSDMIQELPDKFDRPTKMTDNYVWTPDCSLNIKLREEDLKIKELKSSKSCHMDDTSANITYVEQWTTEVFSFPISTFLMKRIGKGLNISNIPESVPPVEDKERFIALLQSQSNSVRVLSISKQREQTLLPIDENLKANKELGELVTVEISHLTGPEDVYTLCIEHSSIDKVIAAISKIMGDTDKKIYRGMVFMNYLQAVKVWGLGKKIFD